MNPSLRIFTLNVSIAFETEQVSVWRRKSRSSGATCLIVSIDSISEYGLLLTFRIRYVLDLLRLLRASEEQSSRRSCMFKAGDRPYSMFVGACTRLMAMWNSVWFCRLIPSVVMLAGPLASAQPRPQPGTLNSLRGEVWMNGIPAGPIAAGRITLESGQAIKTGEGMAELLLTPGSFLRLGDHSEL